MKRYCMLMLFVLFLLSNQLTLFAAEGNVPNEQEVLLVYDSLAFGTSNEGNVDSLKRIIASYGMTVISIDAENYDKGMLSNFSHVIILRNKPDQSHMLDKVMSDLSTFQGKYMHIGAQPSENLSNALHLKLETKKEVAAQLFMDQFSSSLILDNHFVLVSSFDESAKRYGTLKVSGEQASYPYTVAKDKYTYVSYYHQADLSEWALGYILKDWLEVEQEGRIYVLLTEINPFSDLEQLRETSDQLYELGIPFLVSIAPFFNNYDYYAALRYVETLKYVQTRNGSIIIDAPVVSSQTISTDLTTLKNDLSSFIDYLAENGVAPLAASAEQYWFEDNYYVPMGLSFYNSAIMLPNVKLMPIQPTNHLQAFANSPFAVKLEQWQQYVKPDQIIDAMPLNIALIVDMQQHGQDMDDVLQALGDSWILFADYNSLNHTVSTEVSTISSNQGLLTINGQTIKLKDSYQEIEADEANVEETKASLQGLFSVQNKIFIVIIIIVLMIFSVLLVIGYRMYRQKY